MNGFELSRKIKDDPEFSHLPIIALTSLASEEDMQRGMAAGIDDYQIKLDRERLLASVANYLKQSITNAGERVNNTRKPARGGNHVHIIR